MKISFENLLANWQEYEDGIKINTQGLDYKLIKPLSCGRNNQSVIVMQYNQNDVFIVSGYN